MMSLGNGVSAGGLLLLSVMSTGREVFGLSVSGRLAPNRCQISKFCIPGATNAADEHTAKMLHPTKHLLGTQGWPTEQPGAHWITQRSHLERFERVFVGMQHVPICRDRQEQPPEPPEGACPGTAELRHVCPLHVSRGRAELGHDSDGREILRGERRAKEDEGWWRWKNPLWKMGAGGLGAVWCFSVSVMHRLASSPKWDAGKGPGGSYMPFSERTGCRDEPELAGELSQHIQRPPLAAVTVPHLRLLQRPLPEQALPF